MVLTIGMIVKNEAENLARCLDSLEPIRKALESELIIVDTGSDDNTVEIAKKYTNDVRHFEWCKDFSAARNASLDGAKGEWFMFIDADEWFGDSSDLINFFKSDEYKKYNTASYYQRNYSTTDINGRYMDGTALRLTKILPNTKFINPVHEQLNTARIPIKNLTSFVHHFGYLELNNNESKKRARNIELLLKKLELSEGKDVLAYLQLAEVYYGYDNTKALECCRKGIEVNSQTNSSAYYDYIFLKYSALIYYLENEFDNAIDIINEYFTKREKDNRIEPVIVTDIDLYAIKVIVYDKTENAAEIISAAQKFNALYNKFIKGFYHTPEIVTSVPRFTNDIEYVNINNVTIERLVYLDKHNTALEFRKNVPYEKVSSYFGYNYVKARVKQDLKIICTLKKYSLISDLFTQLSNDKKGLELLESSILEEIIDINKDKESFIEYIYTKSGSLNTSGTFKSYIRLYHIFYCRENINEKDVMALVNEHDILPVYLADLLYFSVKHNMAVSEVMLKTDVDRLPEYYANMKFKSEYLKTVTDYINNADTNKFNLYDYIWASKTLLFVLKQNENTNGNIIISLYRTYSYLAKTYMDVIFKQDMLTDENINCLPLENQVCYYSFSAINAFDSGDVKSCVRYLKKAALIDIELKKVSAAMGNALKASEAKKVSHTGGGLPEFEQLGIQVKNNIKLLISQGNKTEALNLINSYREINPGDSDIETLLNQVD